MKRKKQRYNIIKVTSRYAGVEAFLLVRGGDYTTLLTKPAIKTNFYIRDIRIIRNRTESNFRFIIEPNNNGDSVLRIYTENNTYLSEVSGYIYTENTDQFYNYQDAKLFFELC